MLPADAADPQPGDLVAAQPGEQPGQRDRADQLHRIVGVGGVAGQIGGVQVQSSPQQLGPHVVGDHAGIGADQGGDAARHCQRPVRVEPAAVHSHSWQSRKNALVAVRMPCLVRGAIGVPARSARHSRRCT